MYPKQKVFNADLIEIFISIFQFTTKHLNGNTVFYILTVVVLKPEYAARTKSMR